MRPAKPSAEKGCNAYQGPNTLNHNLNQYATLSRIGHSVRRFSGPRMVCQLEHGSEKVGFDQCCFKLTNRFYVLSFIINFPNVHEVQKH